MPSTNELLSGPAGDQRAAGTDAGDPGADPDGYVQARLDSSAERHPSTVWRHCRQEHCWGWGLVQVKGQIQALDSSSWKFSSPYIQYVSGRAFCLFRCPTWTRLWARTTRLWSRPDRRLWSSGTRSSPTPVRSTPSKALYVKIYHTH